MVFNQSADDLGKAPNCLVACEDEEAEDEEELLTAGLKVKEAAQYFDGFIACDAPSVVW